MNHVETRLLDLKGTNQTYWSERILSQLEYGCRLVALGQGDEVPIAKALEILEAAIAEQGIITNTAAQEAERVLAPLSEVAKSKTVVCAAHAHIDMNWMWRFDETVAITIDTFRTMLDLMKEYPDFKFSQSQASVYRIVEQYAPQMLTEIKQRIKEGRWEVTASTWVEADKNMPNGESFARHYLYTKKYLSKLLDIDPATLDFDFEPDTFGHSRHVPEMLKHSGVKFYYHCRGYEGHHLYKWQSPSGANVIVYREIGWYLGDINVKNVMYVPEFCQKHGLDTFLEVYGVGDHGGGPTRRDIERIKDFDTWPVFPHFRFGTFHDFYNKVLPLADTLPVVDDELNFVFTGCYTTQTRIKMANRIAEATLQEAEAFNTFAAAVGAAPYSTAAYQTAWENVLFNQFHDIIPGSGVIDTREYAMAIFQQSMAAANTGKQTSLRAIARMINTRGITPNEDIKNTTSEGGGVGFGIKEFKVSQVDRSRGLHRIFHIFNPSAVARHEPVEVIVWDWQGDVNRILWRDAAGKKQNHQLLEDGFNNYWGHKYLRTLVEVEVPAFGFATYTMTQDPNTRLLSSYPGDPRTDKPHQYILENEAIKATFDVSTGALIGFLDKATGEDFASADDPAAMLRFILEDTDRGMTSWRVGRHMAVEELDEVRIREVHYQSSPLRQSLTYHLPFGQRSKAKVAIHLDKMAKGLRYELEVDFHEVGNAEDGIPQLAFFMPMPYNCTQYQNDIPFGTIQRGEIADDVPGSSYSVGERESGDSVMVVTDTKYGFRQEEDSIAVTLVRGSYDPDPYPEYGIHNIKLGIMLVPKDNTARLQAAHHFNHPLIALSDTPHDGMLPTKQSFVELTGGSVAISAIKMAENGGKAILRGYEVGGAATKATFRLPYPPRAAGLTDLIESEFQSSGVNVSGNILTVDVAPYSVFNVWIQY